MILTAGDIVTDVRAELGRKNDTAILTETRLLRCIGAAQRLIIAEYPTLAGHSTVDKTIVTVKDQSDYDLTGLSGGFGKIITLKYMESGAARRLEPYHGGAIQLDNDVPDIAAAGSGYPQYYVRRDSVVQLIPQPQTAEIPLHIWYSLKPSDPLADDDLICQDFYMALCQITSGYGLRFQVNEKPNLAGLSEMYIQQGLALAAEVAGQQDAYDTDITF